MTAPLKPVVETSVYDMESVDEISDVLRYYEDECNAVIGRLGYTRENILDFVTDIREIQFWDGPPHGRKDKELYYAVNIYYCLDCIGSVREFIENGEIYRAIKYSLKIPLYYARYNTEIGQKLKIKTMDRGDEYAKRKVLEERIINIFINKRESTKIKSVNSLSRIVMNEFENMYNEKIKQESVRYIIRRHNSEEKEKIKASGNIPHVVISLKK